jgi:hypothetical protein
MSTIDTVSQTWECDGRGCPAEVSLTRPKRESDGNSDEIPDEEMRALVRKLGWTSKDEKDFCPECKVQ